MRTSTAFFAGALFALAVAGMSLRAGAAFFGSWVECRSGVSGTCLDGTWWQHLDASQKQAAAQGMIASYIAGYRLAEFNVYGDWLDVYGMGTPTMADKAFLARFREESVPVFDGTASGYVAAIDRFYQKYPSKRALELAGVLRCLAARAEFSCDEVGRSALLPWPTGP